MPSALAVLRLTTNSNLVGLFNRQVGRLRSLENFTDVSAALVKAIAEDRSVAHQSANFDIFANFASRRRCMLCGERDKVLSFAGEERISAYEQRIGTLLGEAGENLDRNRFR